MCKVVVSDQSCGCRDFRELRVAFGGMENCQLKCPFCFTREQKLAIGTLLNLYERVNERIRFIRFTGGEPLLSQVQVDGMVREISLIEEKGLNLDLIIIQTNGLYVKKLNLNGFLKLGLPILFEVSFKGTNSREYSYLTFDSPIPLDRAEKILNLQVSGYFYLKEMFHYKENIAVLARLGIFHSSLRRPQFKFVYPDTNSLMFDPNNWASMIWDVFTDQSRFWGKTFGGKLVVEKLKTPADGSPGMGKRYRRIIEILKSKRLLIEDTRKTPLPDVFREKYYYKRGYEIYQTVSKVIKKQI